jgi:hypothetical protein
VDLLGRYRLENNQNYNAVSFVGYPQSYLPFTLQFARSPSLTTGSYRTIETPVGTIREIDAYMGSATTRPSWESIAMFTSHFFNTMPSPLAFRILGNLSTSTNSNEVAERIRRLGEALFKTRDFKPNGYYHTLARNLSIHNREKIRHMLSPIGSVIRFTIKDIPEYNLLGSNSTISYMPIDPVSTPTPNRVSILDNFRIVLELSGKASLFTTQMAF